MTGAAEGLPVGLAIGGLGTMELVFASLWALFSLLYWSYYRRDENLLGAASKVGGLLFFVYLVMSGFDWLAEEVPPESVITFGIGEQPLVAGPRVPLLANALTWFVVALLVIVAWYARGKLSTVGGLMLSTWDRGHWYMLPVIFVLMTVGLLLVAAAAAPVLSPFIYTLF